MKLSKSLVLELTPVLRLPIDKTLWKKADGAQVGKPGVYWWNLDLGHKLFSEGEPYQGVAHGEILAFGNETVFNFALENNKGKRVYSLVFSDSAGFSFASNANDKKSDDLKVLRAALELSSHLSDPSVKTPVQSGLVSQLQKQSVSGTRLWDRV